MKNKNMKKEDEIKTVVPALRFPEFRELDRWEILPIGYLCQILNNQRKPIPEILRVKGPYPYYGASGIVDYINAYIFDEELLLIGEDGAKWGAYENTAYIANGKFWVNNHAHVLRPIRVNIVVLKNYLIQLDLTQYITGAAPPKLTLGKLKEIGIPISKNPQEQQKIADCFSTLDELIEATSQEVDALKEHKKGLMQRLFPAEGKDVPDLRFPEFQGMKGWEKKQVKDFGEVITGNTPSKKEENYWNGDFVWVTAQDFKGKYINDSILKLTKLGKDRARVIPKDSVLVTCIASIGLNAINKVECSTNQQINTICCNQEYNYEYVYYLVTYNTKNLKQLAGQTAVPIITKKSFEEFEVYVIENYDEQQIIADCLSSIDELIEATSQKVEILKEHKKGLMQQLFPKI